jgi:L-threonylcarbamoyladenylate synthase
LAAHVREDLDGRIAGLVDGGPTGVGLESTVVEVVGDRVHVLRPGGVTADQLRAAVPDCTVDDYGVEPDPGQQATSETSIPKSPGIKYTHYAPRGEMTVVRRQEDNSLQLPASSHKDPVREWIQSQVNEARNRGERTGVLSMQERASHYDADLVIGCGGPDDLETAAHLLYAALRQFDEQGITSIWAEAYPVDGIGTALMNRMVKAAGGRVVTVSP